MAHDMRQSSVKKAAAKNCSPSREQGCANEMHVATNRVAGTDVPPLYWTTDPSQGPYHIVFRKMSAKLLSAKLPSTK